MSSTKTLESDPEYRKIKDSHKLFLSHLMKGETATDAYRLAFPLASHKKAGTRGYELKNRYAALLERHRPIDPVVIERVAARTLENLTLMAFADVGGLVDDGGKPLPLKDVPKELRMAITEIEIRGDKVKYTLAGKVKALEVLSRVARMDQPRTEVNISIINEEERDRKIHEILVKAKERNSGGTEGSGD